MLARRLIAGLAVRTGVVGGEERTDDELARLDCSDSATDLLDDAAVLVPHRGGLGDLVDAAVAPEVGPADARRGHLDDGVRRLDDPRDFALLETHIARSVQNSSSHAHL